MGPAGLRKYPLGYPRRGGIVPRQLRLRPVFLKLCPFRPAVLRGDKGEMADAPGAFAHQTPAERAVGKARDEGPARAA